MCMYRQPACTVNPIFIDNSFLKHTFKAHACTYISPPQKLMFDVAMNKLFDQCKQVSLSTNLTKQLAALDFFTSSRALAKVCTLAVPVYTAHVRMLKSRTI